MATATNTDENSFMYYMLLILIVKWKGHITVQVFLFVSSLGSLENLLETLTIINILDYNKICGELPL